MHAREEGKILFNIYYISGYKLVYKENIVFMICIWSKFTGNKIRSHTSVHWVQFSLHRCDEANLCYPEHFDIPQHKFKRTDRYKLLINKALFNQLSNQNVKCGVKCSVK